MEPHRVLLLCASGEGAVLYDDSRVAQRCSTWPPQVLGEPRCLVYTRCGIEVDSINADQTSTMASAPAPPRITATTIATAPARPRSRSRSPCSEPSQSKMEDSVGAARLPAMPSRTRVDPTSDLPTGAQAYLALSHQCVQAPAPVDLDQVDMEDSVGEARSPGIPNHTPTTATADVHSAPQCPQANSCLGAPCDAGRMMNRDKGEAFHADVEGLLNAWQRGEALEYLASLPSFAADLPEMGSDAVRRFQRGVRAIFETQLCVEEAAQTKLPLWRCTHYGVAVLFEALSRSTGTPAVLYIAAFLSLLGSILHKDIGMSNPPWVTRARYWVAASAGPACGKNAALDL